MQTLSICASCSSKYWQIRSSVGQLKQRNLIYHSAQSHCMAGTPAASRANTGSSQQVVKENAGERARSHLNSAFPFLDFADLDAQTGRVRIRQHVNPLKRELQVPAEPPVWQDVFADPSLPLCIDIGSGGGRFLLALSRQWPRHNFLGLEIRRPLVERGNSWAETVQATDRVQFLLANATVSLQHLLAGPQPYPARVDLVTILHPDPHWKSRLHKRRVVQPTLVTQLASVLKPGAKVVLQSDDLGIAEAIRACFEQHGHSHFRPAEARAMAPVQSSPMTSSAAASASSSLRQPVSTDAHGVVEGWHESCLPVPSDREVLCEQQGLPIYRTVLLRTESAQGHSSFGSLVGQDEPKRQATPAGCKS